MCYLHFELSCSCIYLRTFFLNILKFKVKWNVSNIIDFLQIYKHYSVLWSIKDTDYCDIKWNTRFYKVSINSTKKNYSFVITGIPILISSFLTLLLLSELNHQRSLSFNSFIILLDASCFMSFYLLFYSHFCDAIFDLISLIARVKITPAQINSADIL